MYNSYIVQIIFMAAMFSMTSTVKITATERV